VIVRILGEGQYDVADHALDRLNELDATLEAAVEAGDEAAFSTALGELLTGVRSAGVAHPADSLDESDLILPPSDATIDQVREIAFGAIGQEWLALQHGTRRVHPGPQSERGGLLGPVGQLALLGRQAEPGGAVEGIRRLVVEQAVVNQPERRIDATSGQARDRQTKREVLITVFRRGNGR